ncbi:MAG: 6-carboxytetrahydropterin synthase [Planctomycetota bacterium]|nr:6-carboxytetrahydropterin synthase [Planctomycetota bacterium]
MDLAYNRPQGAYIASEMLFTLSRTTRITIEPHQDQRPEEGPGNNHAGWPSPRGLCAWFEIDVELTEIPDPETGYIIGIKEIDQAVRRVARPLLMKSLLGSAGYGTAELTRRIHSGAAEVLGMTPSTLRLRLSPRHELAWRTSPRALENDTNMSSSKSNLLIREQFEFAASHRLHCPERSDEWNRDTFGKCNNARGHGHNYRVEVVARTTMDEHGMPVLGFAGLEAIVDELVIARFDHRHLNEECEEFADLNPSVENITRVCRDLIREPIAQAGGGLESITVWETEKTSCTCTG